MSFKTQTFALYIFFSVFFSFSSVFSMQSIDTTSLTELPEKSLSPEITPRNILDLQSSAETLSTEIEFLQLNAEKDQQPATQNLPSVVPSILPPERCKAPEPNFESAPTPRFRPAIICKTQIPTQPDDESRPLISFLPIQEQEQLIEQRMRECASAPAELHKNTPLLPNSSSLTYGPCLCCFQELISNQSGLHGKIGIIPFTSQEYATGFSEEISARSSTSERQSTLSSTTAQKNIRPRHRVVSYSSKLSTLEEDEEFYIERENRTAPVRRASISLSLPGLVENPNDSQSVDSLGYSIDHTLSAHRTTPRSQSVPTTPTRHARVKKLIGCLFPWLH